MDVEAPTLGGWAVELVALAARRAGQPGGAGGEPPESANPVEVADRLVEHLRDGFGEVAGGGTRHAGSLAARLLRRLRVWSRRAPSDVGADDQDRASRLAGLKALEAVLADPDDEASRTDLKNRVDERSSQPDFRVGVEHLVREAWDAAVAADGKGPTGICISGGGVRAASYGLGALQALQDERQLVYGPTRAQYLAAVSGGSYIAGAVTMLASRYGEEDAVPPGEFAGDRYPFAPGMPEVEHLRRRARYLLGGGAAQAVLQLALRLFLNLSYLAAVVYVVARPLGWLYGQGLPALAQADQLPDQRLDLGPIAWLTTSGMVVALAGVLVVFVTTFARGALNRPGFTTAGHVLLGTGSGLLFLGLAVPVWLGWVAERWVVDKTTVDPVVEGVPEAAIPWTAWSTIAAVAAAVASFKAAIPDEVGKTVLSRRLRPLLTRLLRALVALVALVSVPVVVVTWASVVMIGGALESTSWSRELLLMGVAAAGLFVMMALRDPMVWSLHPFYKRRLMACYGVKRRVGSNHPTVEERSSTETYLLSQSSPPEVPVLLVCAAANVSGFGNAPAGHNVLPFVFSPFEVGFTDVEGRKTGRFRTRHLERAVKAKPERRNITLPTAVAITGAAFSPSMGKMTIGHIRMLMAVLNLRLGLWLPNPMNRQVWKAVRKGDLPARPTPWYLIKEAVGLNRPTSRLIYVSDGGHYENLGLVELLRKGCRTIWCIDAAGDPPGQVSTLTEAMLLAESELGVRWVDTEELENLRRDTEATGRRNHLATMKATHATLSFELRGGSPGTVTVVKAGVTLNSPNHLMDYQRRFPSFPYDSTANQLFRADRFDAYRSLGYASTQAALRTPATPPLEPSAPAKPEPQGPVSAEVGVIKGAARLTTADR